MLEDLEKMASDCPSKTCNDSTVESDEEVDPRVQGELENLNSASNEINMLETELENGRTKFRTFLCESTQSMNVLFKKLGKCVNKARPYYELLKESRRAQSEAQRAAIAFQRANSVYRAAKETVSLAEQKLMNEVSDKRMFDSAWQEMLNHATMKFSESEKEKTRSETEHSLKANEYVAIQHKLRFLEKDLPRSISKARPYFETKEKLEHHLKAERQNIEDLQRALACAKARYQASLDQLEAISEAVHHKRKKLINLPPRTPGVGAESSSDQSDLPSINLDVMSLSDTVSQTSYDEHIPDDNVSFDSIRGIYNSPSISERRVEGNGSPNINPESADITDSQMNGIDGFVARNKINDTSSVGSNCSSSDCSPVPGDHRRRRRKHSQKAFPILQGLTATSQQMSPRLIRANVSHGRFHPVVVGPQPSQRRDGVGASCNSYHGDSNVSAKSNDNRGLVAKELTAEEAQFDLVTKETKLSADGMDKPACHSRKYRDVDESCKKEEVFV